MDKAAKVANVLFDVCAFVGLTICTLVIGAAAAKVGTYIIQDFTPKKIEDLLPKE